MASSIDTSAIDPTKPEAVQATTQSVRDNFAAIIAQFLVAKSEITALQSDLATDIAALAAHIADAIAAHAASAISNTPAGNIAATTVQDAIDELDSEKQPADATLSSLAALGSAAGKYAYTTAADTWAEGDLSAFARTLLDDADAAAVLTTLGVSAFIQTLLNDTDAATARATLGVDTPATVTQYSPTLSFGGLSTGITYTSQNGQYMLYGNMVTVVGRIQLSSKGTATGNAAIQLPVTSATGLPTPIGFRARLLAATVTGMSGIVNAASDTIGFLKNTETTTVGNNINDTDFTDTTDISFIATYRVI